MSCGGTIYGAGPRQSRKRSRLWTDSSSSTNTPMAGGVTNDRPVCRLEAAGASLSRRGDGAYDRPIGDGWSSGRPMKGGGKSPSGSSPPMGGDSAKDEPISGDVATERQRSRHGEETGDGAARPMGGDGASGSGPISADGGFSRPVSDGDVNYQPISSSDEHPESCSSSTLRDGEGTPPLSDGLAKAKAPGRQINSAEEVRRAVTDGDEYEEEEDTLANSAQVQTTVRVVVHEVYTRLRERLDDVRYVRGI